MAHPGHRGADQAGELRLGVHVGDGHRQAGRREQFLADGGQDVLRGDAVEQAFAEGVEEVGLLDVLLAVEHRHGAFLGGCPIASSMVDDSWPSVGCVVEDLTHPTKTGPAAGTNSRIRRHTGAANRRSGGSTAVERQVQGT